jgi:hypothetical protein
MKAAVPVLIKDPEVSEYKDLPVTEDCVLDEDVFLDGPVCRRVAVLDFDPKTGQVTPPIRFVPPRGREPGRYELPPDAGPGHPAFIKTVAFGGVMKTIDMFEEKDNLGRAIRWAFDGPQLLVVPRAGEWANAFYERDSRSVQLFFVHVGSKPEPLFAAHSQDIIAHETAHAILDGIAPDLYHATAPQALAIHEAIADVTALLMAFRSRKLATAVLHATGNRLARSNAFTQIAEQFAAALREEGRPLRELDNTRAMSDADLDRSEPHALSEVLSGALYAVMVRIYEGVRSVGQEVGTRYLVSSEAKDDAHVPADRRRGTPGYALWLASERFKRTVLRALDYLPPGEVSFADLGRAIFASDQASHPDSGDQREWLAEEFVKRGIVAARRDLARETMVMHPPVQALDLDQLVESDWVAYEFANANRKLLGIPRDIPFAVRPRLVVSKRYYHRDHDVDEVKECLLKVSWSEVESSDGVGGGLPRQRQVRRGTTLAIDWETKKTRALLHTEPDQTERIDRDRLLTRLADEDILRVGAASEGPDGRALRGVVAADVTKGVLRVHGCARMLHLAGGR